MAEQLQAEIESYRKILAGYITDMTRRLRALEAEVERLQKKPSEKI